MNKRKYIILVCISIAITLLISVSANASTAENNKITINGNISYYIKENGNNNSRYIRKILNNYPITLFYENKDGLVNWIELATDKNGKYSISLLKSEVNKVWVGVAADNNACLVTKNFTDSAYRCVSSKKQVDIQKSSFIANVSLGDETAIGAINIARVINNARNFVKDETDITIKKIRVYWTSGKGTDSYTITLPVGKRGIGMFLAGADHDERDESVISHEYGHWVFGTLRGAGRFMSGRHSSAKEIDKKLAYSEGLATFFGQAFLGNDRYIDGNNITSSANYSIETPIDKFKNYYENEVYVSASLWDVIDNYLNNTESWDRVNETFKDAILTNANVVMDAKIIPNTNDPVNNFMEFDCSIKDFYNKYIDEHITKNSTQAYEFWNIYNKNGMQFDTEKPSIILDQIDAHKPFIIDETVSDLYVKLYDNVKVSKVEFYINGVEAGIFTNPADEFNYVLPKSLLKKGNNKLAIKAYDFAKNYCIKDNTLSKLFPANDFFKASMDLDFSNLDNLQYRIPYDIKYIDLVVLQESPAIAQIPSTLGWGRNNLSTLSANITKNNIEDIADTYSLTYKCDEMGVLGSGQAASEKEFTVNEGEDYAILLDDALGDFELTLIDPQGNRYINSKETDQCLTENQAKTQAVLDLGSSGIILFHPTVGTWTYTIENKGTEADYHLALYSKLSAPIIYNEEELLQIQDGTNVEVYGKIVTGSAISVATGSAITTITGSAISKVPVSTAYISLTGEKSGISIHDTISNFYDGKGDFKYNFRNLSDDNYNLILYVVGEDGNIGWKKDSKIIVNSKVPDILLDENYEYYTYTDFASIEGVGINSSQIEIYVNGFEVPSYGESDGENLYFSAPMELNLGNNTVVIKAKTETGRSYEKTLILHSESEETCFTTEHQPSIESVLINGEEQSIIVKKSKIDVKLTDSNLDNYIVYAICNDKRYDFVRNGDKFSIDYYPESGSGNYIFSIYAVSRWQMYDNKNIDLEVQLDDGKLYQVRKPDDIYIKVGDTATLNLNEIFGGNNYSVVADIGKIAEGVWRFKPDSEGVYEITLQATKEESEKYTTFFVYVDNIQGFNVSLNANGGTLENNNYYVYIGNEYGNLPVPLREGYTFLGWFTESQGGTQIIPSSIVNSSDIKILYAHWNANGPQIIFNANGGSVSLDSKVVSNGSSYGELPIPVWMGYSFTGWYTQAVGGTQITATTKVNIIATQTLYAHWAANTYIVTLNANGGTVSGKASTNVNVTYGNTYGTSLITPIKAGYEFLGWYTEIEGGTQIISSKVVDITGSITLYAHWKEGTYTLSFNASGGSVSVTSKKVVYGSTYGELPIPTLANYIFDGWYTLASGGSRITAESTVNITAASTVYAHWTGVTYEVLFDGNGGSVPQDRMSVIYGKTYGTMPVPTKTNYTFAGWYTQAVGGIQVAATNTVSIATTQTLYAHWTGNTYAITLNANGGTVSGKASASVNVIYGNTYGASLITPIKAGYEFLGWYTEIEGGTQKLSSNIVDTSTLYAHWKEASYLVTFNGNWGNVPISNKTVTYKSPYGILPVATRSNYVFQGWYTSTEGGVRITEDSIVEITTAHWLSAQWIGEEHRLTFDAKGGEVSLGSKVVNYGNAYGPLPIATREGYQFRGWSYQANGTIITVNSKVDITEDKTLYASWTGNNYLVTLDGNGGMIPNGNKYVNTYGYYDTYGNPYGITIKPVREGYEFTGWYTEPIGGKEITTSTVVDKMGEHTLYAHWKEASYLVTFNGNWGSVPISNKTVTYKSPYGILPVATRSNYVFQGWYTSTTGGVRITEDSIVEIATAHWLTAQWIGEEHRISFDAKGGEVSPGSKVVNYGSTYGTLPVAIREGYQFRGWYLADGTIITANSTVNITADKTIYASWAGNNYLVTLDSNGGTISNGNKYVNTYEFYDTYGNPYGIAIKPVREGYEFTGWYTEPTGGKEITTSAVVDKIGEHTLYAHWKEASYLVTFNGNGGNIPISNKTVTYKSPYGILPVATRSNYVFQGWYTSTTGGVRITEDSIVEITTAHWLSAQWIGEERRLTFDAKGGEVSPGSKVVNYGSTYGTLPVAIREGYQFRGWYLADGTIITANSTVNITADKTIYASWAGNNYLVTLDGNGGTISNGNKYVNTYEFYDTYGNPYGITIKPVREGYEFTGWYTEPTGGKEITTSTVVDKIGEHTLYAHWKEASYLVTFNGNWGSVPISNKTVTYKSPYGILPVATRSNYVFQGWYTSTEGGVRITEDSIVEITTAHWLAAQWKGEEHRISFDAKGGEVLPGSKVVYYGSTYGSLPEATRKGYQFRGWYLANGTIITANSKVDITEDKTIYASWVGNNYLVTLDGNGGMIPNGSTYVSTVNINDTYGSLYGVGYIPIRTGYEFTGWYTELDGGKAITTNTIVDKIGDHTLYAHWKEENYTVNFDANGGRVPISSKIVTYTKAYGSLPKAVKENYVFQGWYYTSSGGNEITENTEMTMTWAHTLYAQWKGETHKVTFDANGGNVSQNSIIVMYGEKYGTLPAPTRTGYKFNGWYTQSGGSSLITANNIVNISKDQILYAMWSPITVVVYYDFNGGSDYIHNEVKNFNEPYGNLTLPVRIGYTFIGWYTDKVNGVKISDKTIMDKTENHTLYAHWTPNHYKIVFNASGGYTSIAEKDVIYDQTFGYLPTPIAQGYKFEGWYLNGDKITASTIVNIYKDEVLYALWSAIN